jgi:hypothetical protein
MNAVVMRQAGARGRTPPGGVGQPENRVSARPPPLNFTQNAAFPRIAFQRPRANLGDTGANTGITRPPLASNPQGMPMAPAEDQGALT